MWATNLRIIGIVLGTLALYTLIANKIPQVQSEVPHALTLGANVTPEQLVAAGDQLNHGAGDRKSTRLNSSHLVISYAVFCLKKKTTLARRSPPFAAGRTRSKADRPSPPSPNPPCDRYRSTQTAPSAATASPSI